MRQALVVLLVLAALGPVGVASAARTPAQLYAASLAAARAKHSVHYVSNLASSAAALTIVGDAAADRGIQRITFHRLGQTGRVTVVVVANMAYIRGDAFTLAGYLGFPASAAARYAGRWISIPHGHPAFAPVAEAVRLRSTLVDVSVHPPFTRLARTTVGGEPVVGIKGRAAAGQPGAAILYVRARGTPLPVAAIEEQNGAQARLTFSRWNEPVHVKAPAKAVPIARVH
jgi:hypothetical protein